MGGINTGVDDKGTGARTGAVIVGVGAAVGTLVGETSQAPVSSLLGGGDGNNGILLNEVHLSTIVSILTRIPWGQAFSS